MLAIPLKKALLYTLAGIGTFSLGLTLVGLAFDISSFDLTQGGYEPAYTDYTGTPINWDDMDTTPTGMAHRGYVLNVLVDCTTGLISFEFFRHRIPFRPLSPRAIAVHQPILACQERGFDPQFS